jgi:hypothetical protein
MLRRIFGSFLKSRALSRRLTLLRIRVGERSAWRGRSR